jgi:hypothetical protein
LFAHWARKLKSVCIFAHEIKELLPLLPPAMVEIFAGVPNDIKVKGFFCPLEMDRPK